MRPLSAGQAYAGAALAGALLWLGTMALTGRREAWDSPLYWSAAYPLGLLASAALGYLAPHRAWRWGLALMLVQSVVLAATAGGFGLLPLGIIMFTVLAAPPALVATVAGVIRRRAG